MATRNILVVGATGQQGSATVDALLALPSTSPALHIVALTRNPESAKAKALVAAHPGIVSLVGGDLKDAAAVFASSDLAPGGVDALYLFTMPGTPEDTIGRAWVDAALAHGVKQIVLSTVDRGGPDSWEKQTGVKHFDQKRDVELHLRDKAAEATRGGKPVHWTVLRPAAFLDNLNQGFFCGVFNAMVRTLPRSSVPYFEIKC
jgi:uncharacterized protein YbjT (DUF2867 family)